MPTDLRIISTVPSLTELLSYLGLDESIVGITKFCVHPNHIYQSVTRIGGTKQLHLAKIRNLDPDLIIANKEENVKEQIEELANEFEVYLSDVTGLESALTMVAELGELVDRNTEAAQLAYKISLGFEKLRPRTQQRVLYLIWQNPYMSVGQDTFINDMLQRCGLANVCSHLTRYPEIAAGEYDPELILLSSEPFPFKEQHIEQVQNAWPHAKVRLVNGEFFSWYGSRMLEAALYFEALINSFDHSQ